MNKEIPSVSKIADEIYLAVDNAYYQATNRNLPDFVRVQTEVGTNAVITQAITQHTAELQRELEESKDAYFGAKKANMMREAALKAELRGIKEQLTEMNELEQLRAQVIELVMENSRLREGLEFIQENSATRGPRRKAEELLSQPSPTGTGEKVLALARAGFKAIKRFENMEIDESVTEATMDLYFDCQPFIESPELCKMLGVE